MSDLMNREEAALYIGVSVRTLQRYIKSKTITFTKQAGFRGRMEYRFEKKALDDWQHFKNNVTYREDNQTKNVDTLTENTDTLTRDRQESGVSGQGTANSLKSIDKNEQSDTEKDNETRQNDTDTGQNDRQETSRIRQVDSLVDRLLSSLEYQNQVLIGQLKQKDEQITQLTEMIADYRKQFNDRLLEYKQIAVSTKQSKSKTSNVKTSSVLRDDVPEEKRDVLSMMLQLRNEGYSGREIADILNDKQIGTFSGIGNWTKRKVNDTLHRWLQ